MSLEPSHRNQDSDRDESTAYRLRYHFGDLRLYSEWEAELAVVENLAEQLRRGDDFHDVTIEQRREFRFFGMNSETVTSPAQSDRLHVSEEEDQ